MRRCARIAAVAILTLWLGPVEASAGQVIIGPASAIAGDSLEVGGYEMRPHGINAPEWKQCCERGGERYRCGEMAARALAERIDCRQLECDVRDVDRYGRGAAVCFLGGEDVNRWLVREGYAVAYRRYSGD